MPTNAESTTISKTSSISGSIARHLRLPLAHVVREQRRCGSRAGAQRAASARSSLVRLEVVEVGVGAARAATTSPPISLLDRAQELVLGDRALLELVQRVLARRARPARCIALPMLLERACRTAPGSAGTTSISGVVSTPPKSQTTARAHAAAAGLVADDHVVGADALAALHPPREHRGVHAQALERQRRAGPRGARRAPREVLAGQPQLEPGLALAPVAVVDGRDARVLDRAAPPPSTHEPAGHALVAVAARAARRGARARARPARASKTAASVRSASSSAQRGGSTVSVDDAEARRRAGRRPCPRTRPTRALQRRRGRRPRSTASKSSVEPVADDRAPPSRRSRRRLGRSSPARRPRTAASCPTAPSRAGRGRCRGRRA